MKKIKLIPKQLSEESYTQEEYKKFEELYQKEKTATKPMGKVLIGRLKKGKV